jgi:uncharacterized protein (DUF302 family)
MNSAEQNSDHASIVTKITKTTVARTSDLFLGILAQKEVKVFAVIDQRAEAKSVDLELRDTVLVIFGSPSAGTLKILIWAGETGTNISYLAPHALAQRYGLPEELSQRLSAIEGLTDALVTAASREDQG